MRFLCCLALSLFSSLAPAQNQLGARLGVNAATITGEFATSEISEPRIGFIGGFSLTFPLRSSFAIQAEVLYAQKGLTTDTIFDERGLPVEVTSASFELTTLDVPLVLKYGVPLSRDVTFAPYAGPYLGFELAEQLRVEAGSETSAEGSDSFTGMDFGFTVGLDLTVAFQSLQPTFGVRFARSVSNQLEEQAGSTPDATAYNSVVSFLVGIRL